MARSRPQTPRLAVIGGGNLGGAFLAGLAQAAGARFVVEPDKDKQRALKAYATPCARVADLPDDLDLAIITVKPPLVKGVLAELAAKKPAHVVSFAAGVTLAQMRAAIGARKTTLHRGMASTAAASCASTTTLCDEKSALPQALQDLLATLGEVISIADEKWMDAITAVSASAPAFFLLAMEGLSDGGLRLGLPRDLADRLAVGAARAAEAVARKEHMTRAKHKITSPGGTTIAGLTVLERAGVHAAFSDAAMAAAARAKELA
ncbi:MAG: NAD(P)-binding domain-containing protein [Deltaproteobacteria bacterium]|nr:NAD(P)-binding domain-containing protein [Deltaproteobacteria bacterium]